MIQFTDRVGTVYVIPTFFEQPGVVSIGMTRELAKPAHGPNVKRGTWHAPSPAKAEVVWYWLSVWFFSTGTANSFHFTFDTPAHRDAVAMAVLAGQSTKVILTPLEPQS